MSIVAAFIAMLLAGAGLGKSGSEIPQPDRKFKTAAQYSVFNGNGPVWLPGNNSDLGFSPAWFKKSQ